MSLTFIFFSILAILAIASAIATVATKNPVVSALSLIFHFFMLSGLYLTLQAQFIAVIQILVYAGAIMVLVIFVIMLLNLGDEEKLREKFNVRKVFAILFAIVMTLQFLTIYIMSSNGKTHLAVNSAGQSTVQAIGSQLFASYLVPFEAVGILLLAAIVGAVVLAKKKLI